MVLVGFGRIASGNAHSLILKHGGSVWTTGRNNDGQLGDTSAIGKKKFVQIVFSGAKAVAAGASHSMVLKQDGSLWAAGSNSYGQLGGGWIPLVSTSVLLPVVKSAVEAASAGRYHSVMLKQDGSVWSAGANYFGQLGDGSINRRSTFVQVISSGAKAVAAGWHHSMVVKQDGSLWATGWNEDGQLGDGSTSDSVSFAQVISRGLPPP